MCPRSAAWRGMQHGMQLLTKGLHMVQLPSGEQEITWIPSARGLFTTRSAYDLLTTTQSEPPATYNWKQPWQLKGRPRFSLTLWMATHDRLKTKYLLWHRNIIDSACCEICGTTAETTLHASCEGLRYPSPNLDNLATYSGLEKLLVNRRGQRVGGYELCTVIRQRRGVEVH